MVSFTPLSFYPQGKSSIILWVGPGLELRPLSHPARGQSLYRLLYRGSHCYITKTKLNQTQWPESAKRTIPTERPPLVGEVSANFCGHRVPRGQHDVSLRPYSRISRPGPLLFLASSSPIVFTRLSGPRFVILQ
jgi:hypothetical protein